VVFNECGEVGEGELEGDLGRLQRERLEGLLRSPPEEKEKRKGEKKFSALMPDGPFAGESREYPMEASLKAVALNGGHAGERGYAGVMLAPVSVLNGADWTA
jgi:hypothetical protein